MRSEHCIPALHNGKERVLQGNNFKIIKRFAQCILDGEPIARCCYKLDFY